MSYSMFIVLPGFTWGLTKGPFFKEADGSAVSGTQSVREPNSVVFRGSRMPASASPVLLTEAFGNVSGATLLVHSSPAAEYVSCPQC